MAIDFKNLLLDQSIIRTKIIEFCNSNYTNVKVGDFELINETNNSYRIYLSLDSKDLFIDFYLRNDGRTSITTTNGLHTELKKSIAEYIRNNCGYKVNKETHIIKSMSDDDFELLIEYIKESEGIKIIDENNNDPNAKKSVTFSSEYRDKLKIVFYNTGKVLLQGRPLHIFNKAVDLLSQLDDSTRIEALENVFEIRIPKEENYKELEAYLPNSYNKIDDKMKRMLHSSIALKNCDFEADDYTCIICPVFRSLEGHIRKQLDSAGYIIDDVDPIGCFYEDLNKSYVLRQKNKFKSIDKEKKIEQTYTFWNKNRHPYFHMDKLFTRAIIHDKNRAIELLEQSLLLIDEYYGII